MALLDIPARFKGVKPISPQQIVDQGVRKTMGQIAKINGLVLGALAMHFAALGVAAFKGFMIGAIAGGTGGAVGGAIVGAQIGASIGTIVIPIPVVGTVVGGVVGAAMGAALGGTTGAIILGLAGGLIAAGLYAGSATMVSMGVGAGIGGAIGAYAGAIIGSTLGTLLVLGCAFVTGGACAFLAPIIPAMGFAGAAIGAVVGAFVGAAVGYVVGKYIVTPIQSGFTEGWAVAKGGYKVVTGGPVEVGGGVLNTGAVIVSGIGSAITGTASAIWGGITSAGGTILSGLSSGLNFVVGGLTSVGLPASAAMIPVVGGIGVITVGNLLVDTITKPAAWFSSEQDAVIGGTGDNEIYTISKTASDGHIENNEIPRDLTYTVKLTAKADLSNISINDKIEVWREGGQGILINRDSDYNLINPLCGGPPELITAGSDWTCQFIIAVNSEVNFKDSVITNTVTVTASQQGSVPVTDTAFSVTTVGKPPVGCPSGWPTDHGVVTNGPKGSDIHKIEYSQGWAAIDIAQPLGTPTKATFSGKAMVVIDDQDGGGFGTHVILEADCNGKRFQAMWTHLKLHSINPNIKVGSIVNAGDIIGEIDDTGLSDGDHIHYAFNGLEMEPPNIPKALGSIDCYGSGACNVSW